MSCLLLSSTISNCIHNSCPPTSYLFALSNLCLVSLPSLVAPSASVLSPHHLLPILLCQILEEEPWGHEVRIAPGTQVTGHWKGLLCLLICDSRPATITVAHCTFTKCSYQFSCELLSCFSHPEGFEFTEETQEAVMGGCWRFVVFNPGEWAKVIKMNEFLRTRITNLYSRLMLSRDKFPFNKALS